MMVLRSFAERAKQKTCSVCGVAFTCGPEQGEKGCWCENLPHVPLMGNPDQDCLCPKCLAEAIAKVNANRSVGTNAGHAAKNNGRVLPSLVEGEDFYWEGAAMVFTASYHLRRGYCCDSGCRHCPYKAGEINERGHDLNA